jgi:hypothetical protein
MVNGGGMSGQEHRGGAVMEYVPLYHPAGSPQDTAWKGTMALTNTPLGLVIYSNTQRWSRFILTINAHTTSTSGLLHVI